MLRKLLAFILLAFILCMTVSCQKEKEQGDLIFTYYQHSDSYFVKINLEKRDTITSVTIPGTYNGKPVTHIAARGFSFCPLLTTVIISEGITNISSSSFSNCPELTTVILPESITRIEMGAFSVCPKLADIAFPANLTHIEKHAFWLSPLATETENGLIYVDNWLIECEESVTDIVIREGTIGMASAACQGNAKTLTVNAEMKHISGATIGICPNMTSLTVAEENPLYHSKDNCLIETATGRLVRGCQKSKIPNYVTEIGIYAYYGTQKFDNPLIPNSVTKISACAFAYCGDIRTLTVPASVTELDFGAFIECRSLTQITLPNSITTIPEDCFHMCESIESIVLPDSITEIEDGAFSNCDMLKKVVIPAGVSYLQSYLFTDYDTLALFYKGKKGALNGYFKTVYYYSESKPSTDHASYWHFIDGEPTVWSADD